MKEKDKNILLVTLSLAVIAIGIFATISIIYKDYFFLLPVSLLEVFLGIILLYYSLKDTLKGSSK